MSPSPNPDWIPEIPTSSQLNFDIAKANQILDDAGYEDTNGNGIREMPGGGDEINLRYMVRSESETAGPDAEFITGWLRQIGIGTKQQVMNDTRLIEVIGKGDYDMFEWGWTPFVDPDPMLSYFQCNQIVVRPGRSDQLLQRRELVRPALRRALQATERRAQPRAAPPDRPPNADPDVRRGRLQRALQQPRSAGVPRPTASPAGSSSRRRSAPCCSRTPPRPTPG